MKHTTILSHCMIALQCLPTTATPIAQSDISITNHTAETDPRQSPWLAIFDKGVHNIETEDPSENALLLQLDSAIFTQTHMIQAEIQNPTTGSLTFSIISSLGTRAHAVLRDGRWSPTTFSSPKSQSDLRPVPWPPILPISDAFSALMKANYQATFSQYTLNWHTRSSGPFGRVDQACWNFLWYYPGQDVVRVVQVGMDGRVFPARVAASGEIRFVGEDLGQGQIS